MPADLGGREECWAIFNVKPAEFIRPKQSKMDHVKRKLSTSWVCEGKIALVLEPHN